LVDRRPFETELEPFESARESLAGAEERIAELETACEAVRQSSEYEIITHTDPKTRDKVVKLRLKRRFPTRIQRIASSAFKELKIALDQAFCDGAVMLGRPNAKGIYFPSLKNLNEIEPYVAKRCKHVDRRLVEYCIREFKPYYGGDSDGILWSMCSIAGTTHQRLVGAGLEDRAGFGRAVTLAQGPLQLIINKWNAANNEMEVARIPPGSELHLKKDFVLHFEVILSGRAQALSYRPLVRTLHQLVGISDGVISGIEAETNRLLGT